MNAAPLVVGAVIVDSMENPWRVLAARRTRPPELAGKWEFPGGKVEPGESAEEALVREIQEELSVVISLGHELVSETGEPWPASGGYVMRLFFAEILEGCPLAEDSHDEVQWLSERDVYALDWLSSDREALRHVFAPR